MSTPWYFLDLLLGILKWRIYHYSSLSYLGQVVEANKKPGPAAHLQLITPLQIDLQMFGIKEILSFEDLDELHQAFVEPLMQQVGTLAPNC